MAKSNGALSGILLNLAIAVIGLVSIVLLYALVTRSLAPRTDAGREANPAGLVGDILQIEVRNGCGVSGLAGVATQYLRSKGFDVVEVGDHSSFDVDETHVVDRVGDLDAALKVAAALGLPDARVRQDIRPDLYLDASVILGKDYASLEPFARTGEP